MSTSPPCDRLLSDLVYVVFLWFNSDSLLFVRLCNWLQRLGGIYSSIAHWCSILSRQQHNTKCNPCKESLPLWKGEETTHRIDRPRRRKSPSMPFFFQPGRCRPIWFGTCPLGCPMEFSRVCAASVLRGSGEFSLPAAAPKIPSVWLIRRETADLCEGEWEMAAATAQALSSRHQMTAVGLGIWRMEPQPSVASSISSSAPGTAISTAPVCLPPPLPHSSSSDLCSCGSNRVESLGGGRWFSCVAGGGACRSRQTRRGTPRTRARPSGWPCAPSRRRMPWLGAPGARPCRDRASFSPPAAGADGEEVAGRSLPSSGGRRRRRIRGRRRRSRTPRLWPPSMGWSFVG